MVFVKKLFEYFFTYLHLIILFQEGRGFFIIFIYLIFNSIKQNWFFFRLVPSIFQLFNVWKMNSKRNLAFTFILLYQSLKFLLIRWFWENLIWIRGFRVVNFNLRFDTFSSVFKWFEFKLLLYQSSWYHQTTAHSFSIRHNINRISYRFIYDFLWWNKQSLVFLLALWV